MSTIRFLVLVTAALFGSCACAQSSPLAADAVTSVTAAAPSVRIGGGDLLEVSVYGAPEYRYDIRVGDDGSIVLPLAGSVKVGGLSVPAAESAIADELQKSGAFNQPQVTVFAKEYATQGVSVLGEVQKPGIYPLLGERHLLDAISAAGGTTAKAGTVVSITHRANPGDPELVALSYDAAGRPANNPVVAPGDTIMVSKAGVVYVVGDVREPSGILMDNANLTVLQALAMAHGANSTAKLSKAKIIRKNGAAPEEISIPLDKILAAKRPDMTLLAGDIIFVPNSAAKSATRRGLEAVIQAATGMAIYKPLP
jgi:polysaccharide export outer membrane protein